MPETEDLFRPRIYRVAELLAEVSRVVASEWRQIRVLGQIADLKRYTSGHVYFSLKDETSRLSGVIWRSDAARLRFSPEDGLEVVVTGTLNIYAARGQFQIQVSAVEPVGIGALALAFEQLKRRLQEEGLFAPERKRPLPFLPRRVGIVTSPQGAAIRDILNVLERRHPDLHVTIWPARVQGEDAAREICDGIRGFNRVGGYDVLIVARGGGSAEDLAAFNDEAVARAIADSRIPAISAVGHEVDWTIADYVADLRAPTPSAAAELVIAAKEDIDRRILHARRSISQAARSLLAGVRARIASVSRAAAFAAFRYRLDRGRDRLEAAREMLAEGLRQSLVRKRERFARASEKLSALGPRAVLARGYALVFADGSAAPVRDAALVSRGAALSIRLHRGVLSATVTAAEPEEER
jgi:exodeoxyribonuclease VII large subunit